MKLAIQLLSLPATTFFFIFRLNIKDPKHSGKKMVSAFSSLLLYAFANLLYSI